MNRSELRNLPSVERVLSGDALAAAIATYGRDALAQLTREALDGARRQILDGGRAPSAGEIARAVLDLANALAAPSPRPVINATGVIIHTNLGRAPLSPAALAAAAAVGHSYSDLEIDLDTGRRGSRQAHLQSLLRRITGAAAALVVNNNASALLLGLSALAAGREVIVTRSEAVEIGGGFRIPDVLRQSGCTLVDIGTTNRTYLQDYADAVTERTGAFLKAHASNFRVEGFTAAVAESELVALGRRTGIPVLHDIGSGALLPTENTDSPTNPPHRKASPPASAWCSFPATNCSAAPQAGIIVGQRDLIARLERHPLARAVRIDKISLASLTATLTHYLTGEAESAIPVWRMISTPPDAVRARAELWRAAIAAATGTETAVVPARSAIGGGSLPGETLPSWALSISPQDSGMTPESLLSALRRHTTPVIGRIAADTVCLDPRSVLPEQDDAVPPAVIAALGRCNGH